jgi:hypothetical protein
VRKQIEKARAFVHKFSSDLEIRRTGADASPELLALWEELKHAYQAENNAGEIIQDCLDKHAASFLSSAVLTLRRYPKTSEMIRQTKESMNAKVNFPALFERLLVVKKLENERRELQKFADNAKATPLECEKVFSCAYKFATISLTVFRESRARELHLIPPTFQLLPTCRLLPLEHQTAIEMLKLPG